MISKQSLQLSLGMTFTQKQGSEILHLLLPWSHTCSHRWYFFGVLLLSETNVIFLFPTPNHTWNNHYCNSTCTKAKATVDVPHLQQKCAEEPLL